MFLFFKVFSLLVLFSMIGFWLDFIMGLFFVSLWLFEFDFNWLLIMLWLVLVGEAFLLCPFYDDEEIDKSFIFPNDNYNRYPTGENINTYSEETEEINDKNNRVIKLSGKKNLI